MSGVGPDDQEITTALAKGAKGYLSKPFSDPEELGEQVQGYLTVASV